MREQTEEEATLVISMMILAASKAGDYCRDEGYPPPTEEQTTKMSAIWRRAFNVFVAALEPNEWSHAHQEALEGVVEGAAQGAVVKVMGERPADAIVGN